MVHAKPVFYTLSSPGPGRIHDWHLAARGIGTVIRGSGNTGKIDFKLKDI